MAIVFSGVPWLAIRPAPVTEGKRAKSKLAVFTELDELITPLRFTDLRHICAQIHSDRTALNAYHAVEAETQTVFGFLTAF